MADPRPQTLSSVAVPGRTGSFDVAFAGGRVTAVTAAAGQPRRLALPAFHEPHTHADRAFGLSTHPPASLHDAIAMSRRLRAESTARDIGERAARLFATAAAHGAVTMRTHVVPDTIADNLRPVAEAADDARGTIDVEIVAFAGSELDPATVPGRDRLAQALDAGAALLGAYVADNPDPAASLEALLDLAVDTGAPVDVHLDEHLDPDAAFLGHLAAAVIARGLEGRVTAGHCCALGALGADRRREIVARTRAAGITVIVLPALNLYLQDRAPGVSPRRRGLTLVHELLEAGVPVRFGSDNVRDPFYPYGDGDPLEAAWLAAIAAQIDDEATLLAGIAGGRDTIAPGDPAELVVLDAGSLTEALARRPGGREIIRAG